ncbi:MAG: TrkH family potassium uptake protein [Acholeplasmataceae bacterium]|jgi:trk system potassium uptake protein TrkH|nr:TrkH family potassium uptake protein [Acholeplasmataceae bacterium]
MMNQEKKITSGYPLIINYLGIFAVLIGLINLLPLFVLIFYPNEHTHALDFIIPGVASIIIGLFIGFLFRGREKGRLERHQDAVLVVCIWLLAILISAIPFVLTGSYTFSQSIFEVTSGYSTTGLTVVDVESSSHMLLVFRSLLQFFGGVGLVLVLTSAISDKFGMRLYSAEGHSDKLVPNLIRSGRTILSIYIGYILVGMFIYILFGMTPFDAFNHAIAAVATGGFSTKAASIGHYNHLGIEMTTIILMILGGTNFFVHLMLIKGKFKNVFKHVELKLLAILVIIFIPFLVINMINFSNASFGSALRISSFQFFSAITGTGYQTVNSFQALPSFFNLVLILMMVLGAGMGSTAGGMKQYRVALAFKSMYWNIKEQLSHKKTIRTHFISKLGTKTVVDKDEVNHNHSFLMVYVIVLITGTFIFAAHGNGIFESLFEFASALGTVGLSVGITGAHASNSILWTATVGMFLGRLEFYVIFVAIAKISMDLSKRKVY